MANLTKLPLPLAALALLTLLGACGAPPEPSVPDTSHTPASAPTECSEALLSWSARPGDATCSGAWETIDYVDSEAVTPFEEYAHPIVAGTCSTLAGTLLCSESASVPATSRCPAINQRAIDRFAAQRPQSLIYGAINDQWLATPADPSRPNNGLIQLHCVAKAYATPSRLTRPAYTFPSLTEVGARMRQPLLPWPPLPPRPAHATYKCTTCDDLPTGSNAEVQVKLDCLQASLQRARAIAPFQPAYLKSGTIQLIVGQMKLLFELHAHQLSRERADQVVRLYRDEPTVLPACGTNGVHRWDPNQIVGREWEFDYCERILNGHVSAELLSSHDGTLVARCHQLYQGLSAQADIQEVTRINHTLLDRLFTRLGDRLAQASRSEERVTVIAEAFASLQAWYDGRTTIASPDAVDDELSGLLTSLLGRVEATRRLRDPLIDALLRGQEGELTEPVEDRVARVDPDRVDPDILEAALRDTHALSSEVEQELVRAALADPRRVGGTALARAPLLALIGAVVEPLVERLDAVTSAHDLACILAGCSPTAVGAPPRATKVSRLWLLLAVLDQKVDAQVAAQADTTFALSGWKDTFAVLTSSDDALKRALSEVVGHDYVAGELVALDRTTMPPSLIRLATSLARAQERERSYRATGQLVPGSGRELLTGVDVLKRDEVVGYLRARRSDLEGRTQRHGDEIVRLVQSLVSERQNEAARLRLEEKRARIVEDAELLESRRRAHMQAAVPDTLSELTRAFVDVQGAIDGSQYVSIMGHPAVHLSARDAMFDGSAHSINEITARPPITISRGEVLSLAVEGQWAPTCALLQAELVTADGLSAVPVQLSHAYTGPEGYSVVWSNSTYEAASSSVQGTESNTVGVRIETCTGPDFIFTKTQACAYADASLAQSWSTSDGSGDDRRTSASLVSGLYLPTTPLFAPTGSLVVVEMPRGVTELRHARDVHVVRGPHTSIPVRADADLYLVVNDRSCVAADASALTIQLRTLASASAVASQLLTRIAQTITAVRAAEPGLVARGEVLSGELAQLRSDALLSAVSVTTGPSIPVSDYPAPLAALFQAVLDRELLRLERMVRITSIERELYVLGRELAATRQDLAYAGSAQALLHALPSWGVHNLDTEYLRVSVANIGRVIRDFVYPVIDLWYPAVRSQIQRDPAITALLDLEPGRPLHLHLRDLVTLSRTIEDQLAVADITARSSGAARRLVAVSFRRPDVADGTAFAGHSSFEGDGFVGGTVYRTADPTRARTLWEAILRGDVGEVRITPDEIYAHGGTATLACAQELPVLRHLAFSVIRPANAENANPAILDTLLTRVTGMSRSEQSFASASGPVTYQVTNPRWLPVEAPYVYAAADEAATIVQAALYSAQGAPRTSVMGLSPFASFDIDWGSVTPSDLTFASEIVVWMEVESSLAPTSLTWMSSCQ